MLAKLFDKKTFLGEFLMIITFLGCFVSKIDMFSLTEIEWFSLGLYLLSIALLIHFFNTTDLFKNSLYPLWFLAIWSLSFSDQVTDYQFSGSFLLVNWVLIQIINMDSLAQSELIAFDIGFHFFIAFILSPPVVILVFVIYIFFLSSKVIYPKLILLSFIGFLTPLLIFVQVIYLLDGERIFEYYRHALCINPIIFEFRFLYLIPILILLLVSLIEHIINIVRKPSLNKRVYILLFLFFLNWAVVMVFFAGDKYYLFSYFAIAISSLLVMFMQHKSTVVKEIVLWLFLILMILYQFHGKIPRIYSLITEITL